MDFRYWARAFVALIALRFAAITPVTSAAPLDDLTNAVLRGGASNISQASPQQFLRAYMSILARAKPQEIIWYVNAAVKVRPDLAPEIVVTTLNVRLPNTKLVDRRKACEQIADIVQAAVIACPEMARVIVKAAIAAAPFARGCILAAAISAAPDQRIALLAAAPESESAMMSSSVIIPITGTINPADYTPPAFVNSPEQPPSVH